MRASETRNLSAEELAQKESELREEILRLRLKRATGQLPNPGGLRALRRDLARVLTIQTERRKES